MLTKQDLSQIQHIIHSETRKIVQEETRKIVQEELKPVKDDITHIRKDVKLIITFFDREYLELRARVEKIEQHLNLQPSS